MPASRLRAGPFLFRRLGEGGRGSSLMCYYKTMLKLSKEEINHLIKALTEWQAKLERMKPYPSQKRDIKPYATLTKKLVKYRSAMLTKKTHTIK